MNAKRKSAVIILTIGMLIIFLTVSGTKPSFAQTKTILRVADSGEDREEGWGLALETLNKEFMQQHPEVEIQSEFYDDLLYQEKILLYAASDNLPDVFYYWSFPTRLGKLVKDGQALALDLEKFRNLKFLPGALESNLYDGKLYGIPVQANAWVLYYNERLFQENNISAPPATFTDLLAAAKVFRKQGIIPVVTEFSHGWAVVDTLDAILGRLRPDFSDMRAIIRREKTFVNSAYREAAATFIEMAKAGCFPEDAITLDSSAARTLFGEEKAAMFLMGTWQLGQLAFNTKFSTDFRQHVRAAKIPMIEGQSGNEDNLLAWYGTNFVINANTKQQELAVAYLDFLAARLPQILWEKKIVIPAQQLNVQPDDHPLAKDLMRILSEAKHTSGSPMFDSINYTFQEKYAELAQEISSGLLTPEEFCQAADQALEEAFEQP